MKTLTVALPGQAYDIIIGQRVLAQVGERVKKALPNAQRLLVVTDDNVLPLYYSQVEHSLRQAGFQVGVHTVPAGESSKCVQQLNRLWERMMEFGLTRTDGVVALGGGVVGDLAGFAASTILRGVDLVQIPTTLLSQVDSSVGGKTAINLRAGKNLAGTFYQPKLVLMDWEVLTTLSEATFADGMAEVIKYGCIRDQEFFNFLCAHPSRGEIMGDIESVLYTCCNIKQQVVAADERDTGIRMVLNFGHTLGHAFEKAGHYTIWTHGQAVAAGMVAAMELGFALKVTPRDGSLERLIALLEGFRLPTFIDCDRETMVGAVGLDKKGAGEDISVILLRRMGEALPYKMKKETVLQVLETAYRR